MKVGIDIRCLSEGKKTGVEEYTIRTLKKLFEQDKKNEFILFNNSYKGSREDFEWTKSYENVEIRDFRFSNKLLNLSLWFFQWPKIDRLIGGLDVFFSPNISFVALSAECKKILTIHDLSFERFAETFSFKRRLWHFLVNPRRLCRLSDRILAVSQSTKEDLASLYQTKEKKIKVIAPPLDFSLFKQARLTSEAEKRIKSKYKIEKGCILYLGTIEPRKNIEGLIRAYEILREHVYFSQFEIPKLVIAGSRGWKSSRIYKRHQESAYSDDILFADFIEDDDKPLVYKLAKVFVYPSLFEGFGFPPLEAMAAGVPVVASDCSSLPEIVDDAAIMVDPYRPHDIFLAIKSLLLNEELRKVYIERGKDRVAELETESNRNFDIFS